MESQRVVTTRGVPDLGIVEENELLFEDFFEHQYPSLVKALMLVVGNAHEAEDLAEEAFARAWDRWDRVRLMASAAGYVYRTALNLNRNRVRRIGRELRRRQDSKPVPDPAVDAEIRDEVRRALAALPRAQREAIVLVGW